MPTRLAGIAKQFMQDESSCNKKRKVKEASPSNIDPQIDRAIKKVVDEMLLDVQDVMDPGMDAVGYVIDYLEREHLNKSPYSEERRVNEEGGKKRMKRVTNPEGKELGDLAYQLGHQPKLANPQEFIEFDQLNNQDKQRAMAYWRFNVRMEQ